MDNEQIGSRLAELEKKIDAIWTSVEKTRKYFLAVIWISILVVVLPLIGLAFIIPSFLDTYMSAMNGLL